MKHFVSMVDTFMSGWGDARDKTNIYLVACDSIEDAEKIVSAGKKRDEMKRVKYRGSNRPYYNPKAYIVSETNFEDLGSIWRDG